MLTELKIEGFKSFGSPAQVLSLGPLNFIVGANASGKTNLLSALQFLKDAVLKDAEYAVNMSDGVAEVRNKILHEKRLLKPVMISFKLELAAKVNRFRITEFNYALKLDLRDDRGRPEVASENLTAALRDEQGQELKYQLRRNRRKVVIIDPTIEDGSQPREITINTPKQEATRLALGVGFFSLPCVILRGIIENWQFYDIDPMAARRLSVETSDAKLEDDGENLGVILHKLEQQKDKGTLEAIIAGLRSVVPGFRGLKTKPLPIEGTWAFQVLEEKIKARMNPYSVSDGTIRLLALMVIANWTVKHSSLVAIEEPENGVHPHLSEHIVSILRAASEHGQIIVTSHNPAFLDYLEPNEVILCDKVNGFTQLRHASDVAQIEAFRKHFRLGELWLQGALGGIP